MSIIETHYCQKCKSYTPNVKMYTSQLGISVAVFACSACLNSHVAVWRVT